jgi:DNA-directed RNA polymerase subunit L
MNIKEILNTRNEYDNSCLKLEISGTNVCYQTINSIRKVCINQIPIYAFHSDKITITKNTSCFDNSEMRGFISNLPISNLYHEMKFLALKYYKNVNFADPQIERHPDDTINITYSLKIINNGTEQFKYVTTNDLVINMTDSNQNIVDVIIDAKTKYSEKNPILLIILTPEQEFECTMKSVLAVGELDAIFNASNTYYEEITTDKFLFSIESSGQLTEYVILIRACEIIIEKFKLIKENLNNDQYITLQATTNTNYVILELLNEDHTCGGPLNWVLQSMPNVKFSGVNRPDYMQKIISITMQCDDSEKPLTVINKAIDKTIDIYEEFKKNFTKLYDGSGKHTKKK